MVKNLDRIEVRLSFPSSNQRSDNYSVLTLTDRDSSTFIAEVILSAEDLASIIGNRGAVIPGTVQEQNFAERFGKVIENKSYPLPEEFKDSKFSREVTDDMKFYLTTIKVNGGWDEAAWRRHNTGWMLHCTRWVEKEN